MRTSEHLRGYESGWPDIAGAAAQLHALRRLALQRAVLAVASAATAGFAFGGYPRVAVAFGAGSLAEAVLAVFSRASLRDRLRELATQRDAYVLPEVRRFGASLTTQKQRLAVARSIAALLRESSTGDSIFLLDRVVAHAPALAAIGSALADSSVSVEPAAVASLQQLLTDGSGSPLLNPELNPELLERTLRLILAGIEPRPTDPRSDSRATNRRAG